jgi:HAD superfamily phosphatase (TIGR01668 family)
MKKIIPHFYAKSIYSLEPSFFKENGIKIVLSDLDNTLDAFDSMEPNEETISYVNKLKENGIKVIIISNNTYKRVSPFANKLGVDFLHQALKPFGFKIRKYLKKHGLNPNDVCLVGDQLLTDVLAGKRAKIRVCLTDPLVTRDQWTTFFNRKIDRKLRQKMVDKKQIVRIGG